jgi:hypothetical protein
MNITLLPTTKLGIWSVVSAIGVFVFYVLRRMVMILGHRSGGATFFNYPDLAILLILAGFFAVASLINGVFSFFKKERSILVLLSTIFGLLVTLFWLGEIMSPH